MGIAGEVVDHAHDLMGPHVVKVEELLASVADQRRRIEEERAALLADLEPPGLIPRVLATHESGIDSKGAEMVTGDTIAEHPGAGEAEAAPGACKALSVYRRKPRFCDRS